MIYAVIGTDSHIRKKAFAEILNGRRPTLYIGKEMLFQVSALIDAQDIFGGEVIVMLEQTATDVEGRDILKAMLPRMQTSKNVFILDEPFTEMLFAKTLEKVSEKIFNAREETEKKGFPTRFLDAFERRDKKGTWVEWMKLRDGDAEGFHGALWWKIKMIWQGVKSGKRGAFSEEEIAKLSYTLICASHKAHRGEVDLSEEIEKMVLSI